MKRRSPSPTSPLGAEEPAVPDVPHDPGPVVATTAAPAGVPAVAERRPFRLALTRGIIAFSLIAALLCGALGYASVIRRPAKYQSTSILLIDQPLAVAGASSEGVLLKLAALRVKYATLARTRRLITPVAQRLKIPVAEVARSLLVIATGNSLVVLVTARSPSPTRARDIANASAEEIITYAAQEQEANKIPAEDRVIFSVIDPAFPGSKIEPTTDRARLIAALAAAIAFVVVFGLGQLLPRRPR